MADEGASVWFQESEMLYSYVIDTVVLNCKEYFLDEGVPEDVLLDLKAIWEHHVQSSRATENVPALPQKLNGNGSVGVAQLDGMDSSGEEGEAAATAGGEGGTLNVSEEITSDDDEPGAQDPQILMDTDNILVCQYDKVVRVKNKFKMQLKAGIMTVNEKDYVFHKCSGEVDW